MDVSVSAAYKSVDEIEYAGGAATITGLLFTNINGDVAMNNIKSRCQLKNSKY